MGNMCARVASLCHGLAGRRVLAFVDAVAWPTAWATSVLGLSVSSGLASLFAVALCAVSALTLAHRAIAHNHHHFSTWRWGHRLVFVLAIGYALELAVLISA